MKIGVTSSLQRVLAGDRVNESAGQLYGAAYRLSKCVPNEKKKGEETVRERRFKENVTRVEIATRSFSIGDLVPALYRERNLAERISFP